MREYSETYMHDLPPPEKVILSRHVNIAHNGMCRLTLTDWSIRPVGAPWLLYREAEPANALASTLEHPPPR